MMDGMGPMMLWGLLGLILALVLLFLFIVAVAVAVRRIWGRAESGTTSEKALDILKQRYARGEITREEFERIKKGIE